MSMTHETIGPDRNTPKDSCGATSFATWQVTRRIQVNKKHTWIPQDRRIHKISWMLPIQEVNDWMGEVI